MKELIIKLKNPPADLLAMFEAAFEKAATQVTGEPLEIPADGLEIDFEKIDEPQMEADLIRMGQVFIMAHSWIIVKKKIR